MAAVDLQSTTEDGMMVAMSTISDLARAVGGATCLGVLTGAGVSTDCGIPDFRGPNGVWTKNPSLMRKSNLADFRGDPEVRRHHWTNPFYASLAYASPGAAHLAIHRLNPALIMTQNIDGLHAKAGDADRTVELHGTYATSTCLNGWHTFPSMDILAGAYASAADEPFTCPSCGPGVAMKRDIVLFGEDLNETDFDRASAFVEESCDVLLCVGSTLSVFPVAGLPLLAKRNGAKLAIVNLGATDCDDIADVKVDGDASAVLTTMLDLLDNQFAVV